MDSASDTPIALFVLWQSLVVKSYRSFFVHLTQATNWRLALASPTTFRELAGQHVECNDPSPPFGRGKYPFFVLRSLNIHIQIVLFWGLGKALRDFFFQPRLAGGEAE